VESWLAPFLANNDNATIRRTINGESVVDDLESADKGHAAQVTSISVASNGAIASISADYCLKLRLPGKTQTINVPKSAARVHGLPFVQFNATGTKFFVATPTQLHMYAVGATIPAYSCKSPDADVQITCARYSQTSEYIIVCYSNGTICITEASDFTTIEDGEIQMDRGVHGMSLAPHPTNPKSFAVCGSNGIVYVHEF